MSKDMIFWFENPPGISRGVFNEVTNQWDGKCYYISMKDTRAERKAINWDKGGYGKAELIIAENLKNASQYLNDFLERHREDIHIFAGYKGQTHIYLDKLISLNSKKLFLWAERPIDSSFGRKLYANIVHRYYALKYRSKVQAFFALGKSGVELYNKLGWKKNCLFPFLYLPISNLDTQIKEKENGNIIKFIYVGRFSKSKGLNILMEACAQMKTSNWTLDLVGGYGELAEKVKIWAESMESVSFLGRWDISQVESKLQEYDVCIVPSIFDGWNVTANKAINAGIGTIITDTAGSDDLIEASGAGIVIKGNSKNQLSKAMDWSVNNPEKVRAWKRKALEYKNSWNENESAHYFISVINCALGESTHIPEVPWLK